MNNEYSIIEEDQGIRLDKFLASKKNNLSRSYIQDLIKNSDVMVDGKKVKNSYSLKKGDTVTINIPEPKELDLKAKEMGLDILFEDKEIIVVNKNAGLLVHPSPHNKTDTLVNGLLAHTDDLSGIGGVKRPGIVHRLDRDTSGAIVVAKNDTSHKNLVNQFKDRKTRKIYYTLVKGRLKHNKGKIEAPIGRDPHNRTKMAVVKRNSKRAVSHFEVMERFNNYTLVKVRLGTGRTHQIRVHMSYMGNPVLGDLKYGKKDKNYNSIRQMLHALNLGFFHPQNKQWVSFKASLPKDFQIVLEDLRKKA
jgi:23S rRNA pseudouridine1911/1915/1917 synthase